MGAVLNFPGIESPPAWAMPTILTGELLQRIAIMNATARKLRALGYRVVDEDASPNDEGTPIIQIELNGVGARSLQLLADCAVLDTTSGVVRLTIDGVRVFWFVGTE